MEGYICRYATKCPLFDYTSQTCMELQLLRDEDRSYCGQWRDIERLGFVKGAMHTRVKGFKQDFSHYIATLMGTKIKK